MRHARRVTKFSGEDIYRIAAHMVTDLASSPATERGALIGKWAERLEGDQQAHLVAAALDLSLTAFDLLGVDPATRQSIEQQLASGRAAVGPLPAGFDRPQSALDQLGALVDSAFPDCPRCGARMDDAGELDHPRLHCPNCGYDAILTD